MIYLLDTNVISELRKAKTGRIDHGVRRWAAKVAISSLYLSAISVLELELGILLVERRDRSQALVLRAWLEEHVLPTFSGRILPVDTEVARRCAALHVPNPRPDRDSLIAATSLVHGMTLVTRNVEDFRPAEVEILNPWEA